MREDFIKLCFLYSRSMNIYGDRGNIICLQQRARWRGKKVVVEEYNIGDDNHDFSDIDLFFFGGGQDMQQVEVANDLKKIGESIKKQVLEKQSSLLAICGGLQLLSKYYKTADDQVIDGIGLFDAYTLGGKVRFIGNVVAESSLFGKERSLVGFENHSGRTYANWDVVEPLGRVVVGSGNNGEDGTEGVVYKNAVGSYLHGSLLPKNPWLADWLLLRAFQRRYGDYQLADLDDEVEISANKSVVRLAKKVGGVKNISNVE